MKDLGLFRNSTRQTVGGFYWGVGHNYSVPAALWRPLVILLGLMYKDIREYSANFEQFSQYVSSVMYQPVTDFLFQACGFMATWLFFFPSSPKLAVSV